ncbi:MAG: hypothetical protein BWK80_62070 [Desulfobacteraceae bacterium IS3]|nr:MAG: hypothetical protein BWK80_62070 [Desulfobacteraceae bacterium IS3]
MAKMNNEKLVQALGQADTEYQNGVIDNLRTLGGERGNAVVRFGLTGQGQTPNYQIEVMMDDGKAYAHTFNGKNHEPHTTDSFNKNNISKGFSLKELLRIFGR